MWTQRLLAIVWPAFIAACGLELVVFALVDPQDILWSGQPIGLSRPGVYTAAFFIFWAICTASGALTTLLGLPPREVNGDATAGVDDGLESPRPVVTGR